MVGINGTSVGNQEYGRYAAESKFFFSQSPDHLDYYIF